MLKRIAILSLSLMLAGSEIHAQMPAAGIPGAPAQVGIVAAVRGAVQIAKGGLAGKIAGSGMPVYLGDEIKTDDKGTLQILLLDESIFTVGPSSRIVIDEFVYDPSTGEGSINAKVGEGIFRFVTGKIARKKPEKMKVSLPVGSIGVRGTIFALESRGGDSLGVLLGPGARHNTQHRQGGLIMSSEGKETRIDRTGFGARIGQDGELSGAFEVPEDVVQRMTSSLSAPPQEENDSGGQAGGTAAGGAARSGASPDDQGNGAVQTNESATAASGQAAAGTVESAAIAGSVAVAVQSLDAEVSEASRREAASEVRIIANGISQKEDLRTLQTGQYHYHQTNVPFDGGPTGKEYEIRYDIDFGARTVGGGNSRIVAVPPHIVSPSAVAFNIPSQSFASGGGNAVFQYNNLPDTNNNCDTGACIANLTVTLQNEGGVPGAKMTHILNVIEDSGAGPDSATGSGTTDRLPGLSTP